MRNLDVIAVIGVACRSAESDSLAQLLAVYGYERASRALAPEPQLAAGIHRVQL
jgi:hypothetical protein